MLPSTKHFAYYKLNGNNEPSSKLTHSFVSVSCGSVMSVHHTDPLVFPDAVFISRNNAFHIHAKN
jgi:hypothetical protein